MKEQRKILFLLTKEQWLGVIILTVLVVGTLFVVKRLQPPPQQPTTTWANDSTKQVFKTHQIQQDSIRKKKKQYSRDTISIRMQDFDPNTVDSSTLRHLGFKPWQASNMLKYRAKGGKYRKPEDLKRLYGMTDSMYHALSPYISIAPDTTIIPPDTLTLPYDSLFPIYPQKKDTIINLRTADTTELKLIRGIGSYRAKQIIQYRDQLGGFHNVQQIAELPCFQSVNLDSIISHFFIDSIVISTMPINTSSVQRLSRHPYLRFEEAKAIYEFRRRHIRIDSIMQLQEIDVLSEETLKKIAPYLNFDKK